jgi:photosystem II stability/assembly factor-like uncharacterized protein
MTRNEKSPARTLLSRTAALGLLVAVCSAASALEWEELGPAPILTGRYTGRVSAIVCSKTNPDLYYVAGADGGVWRTYDGGATWTPLTDFMPTTAIGALALDPVDEQIIYAGTGEANYAHHSRFGLGLYKSTDGGDNWETLAAEVFSGRCFSRLLIDPVNPQRLYAAITPAGGFPALCAAKGHPGATGPVGVFRSDDAGVTWTQLLNGLPNLAATDLAMDPVNPAILYAAIGHIFGSPENGIYKSTDGGDSWTKLGGGLPTEKVGRISVSVAPSLPTRLYALICHSSDEAGGGASTMGAYRSDTAGATWETYVDFPTIQGTYGWYLSIVGIDPANPDIVFMGGVTLVRSGDEGIWHTVTPPHVDMHAIVWDAAGRVVVGDDGGVHRSEDGGWTWSTINEGLGLIQGYAGFSRHQQEYYMFIGTQDNGTLRRNANGTWTNILGGDGGWTQTDPVSTSRVFAEFQGTGNLYRSTSLGSSFTFVGTGISSGDRNCFMPPYLIDPNDSAKMLYATHRIYRSTNYGSNWTAISSDLTGGGSAAVRSLAMAPSDPYTLYASTNDGRVLVSTNGGYTWTIIRENVPGWSRIMRQICVHPTDPQTAYVAVSAFGEQQILRTTDQGQTWTALDGNFPDIPANVIAVDIRTPRPTIFVGAEDGLYRSVNDGVSWHRYGAGLPRCPVIDISFEPDRSRLIVSTQGRGVWRIPIGVPADMNGDTMVNAFDIDAFVLALTDPAAFAVQYPTVDVIANGDINGDGLLNAFDIDGFVGVLTGA